MKKILFNHFPLSKMIPSFQFQTKSLWTTLLFSSVLTGVCAQVEQIMTFSHDAYKIRSLAFSADSRQLVVRSGDETITNPKGMVISPSIHIWEIETKRKVHYFPEKELYRASCISPDGNLLAFREANNINVMDLNSRKIISVIRYSENKNSFARPLAFIAENKSLVIEQGQSCTIYTVQTGHYEREFPSHGAFKYFSADDNYYVEANGDSVRLFDFAQNKELALFRLSNVGGRSEELKHIEFSPDSKFFATHSDNKIRLWETSTPGLIPASYMPVLAIAPKDNFFGFNVDGRYYIGGNDTLKLWDLVSRKEVTTPLIFEHPITTASFSPDGKYLAAGDTKGNVKVWLFTDETASVVFYKREIEDEMRKIKDCGEFERKIECEKRKQRQTRIINNRYLGLYSEKVTTDRLPQDRFLEDWDIAQSKQETLRLKSRRTIALKIDSISMYNADKEFFTIRIVAQDPMYKYAHTEVLKFPRRDGASCFKQNYTTVKVEGTAQLAENLTDWDIFNIKIKCNCTGREKDYVFGLQRRPD